MQGIKVTIVKFNSELRIVTPCESRKANKKTNGALGDLV